MKKYKFHIASFVMSAMMLLSTSVVYASETSTESTNSSEVVSETNPDTPTESANPAPSAPTTSSEKPKPSTTTPPKSSNGNGSANAGGGNIGGETGGTGDEPVAAALRPNILISYYTFGGDNVAGGETFNFNFTLQNTSKNIAVKNMTVKLSGGEVFAQSSGSNTLYIESIGPQKAVSRSMDFSTALSATTGSHPITVSVAYEYYDNGMKAEGSAELSVSIPVVQKDKIQLHSVGLGDGEIFVFESYDVNYGIINSGFTKLYNATAHLFDEAGTELASAYLGTIEPGTESKSNGNLFASFEEMGEKKLTFKLTYENEAMQPQEISEEISVNVTEMINDFPVMDPEPIEPEPQGLSVWGIIGIAAGVLVLGGGVTTFLLIRRKKKLGSIEEDEDI